MDAIYKNQLIINTLYINIYWVKYRLIREIWICIDDDDDDDDDDGWCFTAPFVRLVGRAISKCNEAKSKMKQPSDMPTPKYLYRGEIQ